MTSNGASNGCPLTAFRRVPTQRFCLPTGVCSNPYLKIWPREAANPDNQKKRGRKCGPNHRRIVSEITPQHLKLGSQPARDPVGEFFT
jgi:hypothetical protein